MKSGDSRDGLSRDESAVEAGRPNTQNGWLPQVVQRIEYDGARFVVRIEPDRYSSWLEVNLLDERFGSRRENELSVAKDHHGKARP